MTPQQAMPELPVVAHLVTNDCGDTWVQLHAGVNKDTVEPLCKVSDAITYAESLRSELEAVKDTLQFVERWANHHGAKPHMTAEQTLGCIQHYPPIVAITRAYSNGKVPETRNPWAELEAARAALDNILRINPDNVIYAFQVTEIARATLSNHTPNTKEQSK